MKRFQYTALNAGAGIAANREGVETRTMMQKNSSVPTAFASYAWEDDAHNTWVHDLAARLRRDGVDVTLDRWHAVPGDQLPEFMERAVRDADYVLVICTPRYKEKSDGRSGGVGYEGDIMTAEVFTHRVRRKFIPILRQGEWKEAAPSWLLGTVFVDFRGNPYSEEAYLTLLRTLHGQGPQAPPLGSAPEWGTAFGRPAITATPPDPSSPITITKVLVDQITAPRNDGTRGSGLYAVPFQLSRAPSPDWAELFVETWRHPPSFTSMHRSNIARVVGDRIILDGTTVDEVEQYHLATLKLVVERVNQLAAEREATKRKRLEEEARKQQVHDARVREIASRLTFDTDQESLIDVPDAEQLPLWELKQADFDSDAQIVRLREQGWEFRGVAPRKLHAALIQDGYRYVVWRSPDGKLYRLCTRIRVEDGNYYMMRKADG